jgi:outer membrane protein
VNFTSKSVHKLVWALAATSALAMPAAAQVKVGVVDYARLMEESPQAKAVQDAIRAEFGPRNQQILTQQQALKAREDKLQKDSATMSADQRTKTEKELRDGYRELQRKQQEAQDDFNARRNEEMGKLQRTLIEEVRTYAKTQALDIVIADGVIYATDTVNITPAVLLALQGKGARPAAAPPAANKPKP